MVIFPVAHFEGMEIGDAEQSVTDCFPKSAKGVAIVNVGVQLSKI